MKQNYTLDDVYKVSLIDDAAYLHLVSGFSVPAIDATNVRSVGENDLYLINRYDKGLYRLHLKELVEAATEEN